MSQKILVLTLVLLCAALVILASPVMQPAPISAQEGGSTLTPAPSPEIHFGPVVVGLPFSDTFDTTAMNWIASGAWRLDTDFAYDGTGWFVDGSQRNVESFLEYSTMIDLAGTQQGIQLMFRQKGTLPDSDFIAIDLSLTGGETWFMVDMQTGIQTATQTGAQTDAQSNGWQLHVVDLSEYRGQVVRLRFRVFTGVMPAPDEEIQPGLYQIDNVSIQYVAASDPLVAEPLWQGASTLMGLHLVVGSREEPVLDLVKRMRDIGWPVGTIKGTSSTEKLLNEIAEISPETVIVYRSLHTGYGMIDCPNTNNSPVDEARTWMAGIRPYWREVNADYYEVINECLPPLDWLIEFSIETMRIATAQGDCLLLFSFGPGNPELYQFAQLQPVLEYALANPCKPGRYHGIALHAYGIGLSTLVSESGIYLGLRHRLYYADMVPRVPNLTDLPVYLTEAGPGNGSSPFTCDQVTRDVIQYTQQLEYDSYIKGFHLWTVGGAPGRWLDVTPCLPMIGDALVNYYSQKPRPTPSP
ncbi:MAG: immune inhibitor A [Anaerolineae bacterium]|nr:immune inhibitor A [Anaerolineae bacterium]